MISKNKRISKYSNKQFEKCLFEDDFSDAITPPVDEENQADGSQGSHTEKTLTPEDLAQAESEGYSKGLAEGKKQAAEDYAQALKLHTEKLTQLLGNIDTARLEIAKNTEEKAFSLLEVALDKLLADARQHYPDALLRDITKVLESLTQEQKESLTIHTAPETYEFLTKTLLMENKLLGIDEANLKQNKSLQAGDCLIDWAQGGADMRLDKLKDSIISVLQKAQRSGQQDEINEQLEHSDETSSEDAKGDNPTDDENELN